MKDTQETSWLIGLLGIYVLCCAVIVNPQGNFPLNDDLVYGLGVQQFLKTGVFKLFAATPVCYLHVGIGILAASIFGFSFTVLRYCGIACGLLTCVAIYKVLRELRAARFIALTAILTFAFNPLVLNLAFSFMTDVPAAMLLSWYLFFMIRGIHHSQTKDYFLASIALLCSIAIRQTAIVLVVANLFVLLLRQKDQLKKSTQFVLLWLLVIVPIIWTILLQHQMLSTTINTNDFVQYQAKGAEVVYDIILNPLGALISFTNMLGITICYLAVFTLPILIAVLAQKSDLWKWDLAKLGVLILFVFVWICTGYQTIYLNHKFMPFLVNIWHAASLGTGNIIGASPNLEIQYQYILTILSMVFSLALLLIICAGFYYNILYSLKKDPNTLTRTTHWKQDQAATNFCFVVFLLTLFITLVMLQIAALDRYCVMPLIPVVICLSLVWQKLSLRYNKNVVLVLLAIMGWISIAQEHDYMCWNRARWQLLNNLEKIGVKPCVIDGGAEYNFAKDLSLWGVSSKPRHFGGYPRNLLRWYPINGEEYIVSSQPLKGYRIIVSKKSLSLANLQDNFVFLLKRL